MPSPAYSIGIDLGTTNSALAYCPLGAGPEAPARILPIPQQETATTQTDAATLPSFLLLPAAGADWIPGRLARKQAAESPDRVAHSAKSWLCHHAVDRSEPFLPWGSDSVAPADKLSPIGAASLILGYLRNVWDQAFPEHPLHHQQVTVTVPASFDAVAQRLTLEAAAAAGFPSDLRLLEEPQAAFYRWLESHPQDSAPPTDQPDHVLVVDIGGGTSDFSLFEVTPGAPSPTIVRLAVSDHLLLGGDNIDLAIAHLAEPQLTQDGRDSLSGSQWAFLVARARDLKERCLAGQGAPAESFPIAIPGRGSGLVGGTLTARLERSQVETVLLDGFFPRCEADAEPEIPRSALKEWGLPYAADSAITRHLAAFLRNRPRVSRILFNGGSLYPEMLRHRIRDQVAHWQDGHPPEILTNPDPDLAVALGAARSGALTFAKAARIQAGAARSIYLEARQQEGGSQLVCVLPRGAAPGERFSAGDLGLELRTNRPVRFRAFYSSRRSKDKPGMLIPKNARDFHPLPALKTVARSESEDAHLPVTLEASLNELGLLQVVCRSDSESFPLEFDLRASPAPDDAPHAPALVVDPSAVAAAEHRILDRFGSALDPRDPLTAARLTKSLEESLGLPRSDWDAPLLRTLWPTVHACIPCRANSPDHEEAWLILAGYLLRPGFGAEFDPARIDQLWELRQAGLAFPSKRLWIQEYILWRRVAGGLDRPRQEAVLTPELDKLKHQRKPAPELVRLAGALERLPIPTKTALVDLFLARATDLIGSGGHLTQYLAALSQLLNRTPLYTGPEAVLPPQHVERTFDALADADWSDPRLAEVAPLFLRAARVTDNRALDLPKSLRLQIATKLEKQAGTPDTKAERIRRFIPIVASDQSALFGESLPPGLVLKS